MKAQEFFLVRVDGEKFGLLPFTDKKTAKKMVEEIKNMVPGKEVTTDIQL